MMNTNENNENETFLADWIAGKIPDGQLAQMVSETDFKAYQNLRESMQDYRVPSPDMESNYAKIQQKIAAKKQNKRPAVLPLYRYSAIAASLLLLVGLYQLFVFSNLAETGFGKTQTIRLKDDSQVTLNARSHLSFPSLFKYHRTLKLDGEAFFEVQKGSAFTVKTEQGDVGVLGTKFNVVSRPGFFEVVCFEGKVKVSSHSKVTILKRGDAIRFYGDISESWKVKDPNKPLWMSGESGFRNTPLQHVLSQLQNQYGYEVQYPKRLGKTRFTGSFSNADLDTALQSVCIPLNLKYTKTASRIIISE